MPIPPQGASRVSRSLLAALAACLLITDPAAAQGLTAGVRAGVNVADLSFPDEELAAFDPIVRFVAGGYVTVPLTSWLELQPEALYSMKGASSGGEGGIETEVLLDYLEVPILARHSWRGRPGRAYFILGGPAFGVRLRARSKTAFNSSVDEVDLSDDIERLDVGITAGGGVELGAIVIDARYTFGLGDLDASSSAGSAKIANRVFSVTAGLRF